MMLTTMKRCLVLALALAPAVMSVSIAAEQIKLSDGKYVQGDIVGQPDPAGQGVTIRLTSTGGEVFLRWTQIDETDRKRMQQVEDPTANLNLEIKTTGARLELVTGEILEGKVDVGLGGNYIFNNVLSGNKDREIKKEDVVEFLPKVEIDAANVMKPEDILAQEETFNPPSSAKDYYRLALLAERLGLYEQAKLYITDCLNQSPPAKIQQLAEKLDAELAELIKQAALLAAVKGATDFARKKQFQNGLDLLDTIINDHQPTGTVLDKLNEVRTKIDADYTKFVIQEWYRQMKPVASRKARDKEFTVDEAMAYARGELERDILKALVAITKGKEEDQKTRFMTRDTEKLPRRSASFGRDGWYAVVGGPLPVAGNVGMDDPDDPNPPRANPPRGGGGGGRGQGSGSERSRGGGGFYDGEDSEDNEFQARPVGGSAKAESEAPGIDRELVKDLIRRMADDDPDKDDEKSGRQTIKRAQYNPDDARMKIPKNTPSIQDWWKASGSSRRADWIVAFYALNGGTLIMVEEKYEKIYFK